MKKEDISSLNFLDFFNKFIPVQEDIPVNCELILDKLFMLINIGKEQTKNNHLIPKDYYNQWQNKKKKSKICLQNGQNISLDSFCQSNFLFTNHFEKNLTQYIINKDKDKDKIQISTEKIDFFRALEKDLVAKNIKKFTFLFDNTKIYNQKCIINPIINEEHYLNLNNFYCTDKKLNFEQILIHINSFKSRQHLYRLIKNNNNNSQKFILVLKEISNNPHIFAKTSKYFMNLLLMSFLTVLNHSNNQTNKLPSVDILNILNECFTYHSQYNYIFNKIIDFIEKKKFIYSNSIFFAKIFENFLIDYSNYTFNNETQPFYVFNVKESLLLREAPISEMIITTTYLSEIYYNFYGVKKDFINNEQIIFFAISPHILLIQGPCWLLNIYNFLVNHNINLLLDTYNKNLKIEGFIKDLSIITGFTK